MLRRGSQTATTSFILCRVLQGPVLGPILFVLYTTNLIALIEHHGLSLNLCADDTQVYGRIARFPE